MSPIELLPALVRDILSLNTDLIAIANGTVNPDVETKMKPMLDYMYIRSRNVTIDNSRIQSIDR